MLRDDKVLQVMVDTKWTLFISRTFRDSVGCIEVTIQIWTDLKSQASQPGDPLKANLL